MLLESTKSASWVSTLLLQMPCWSVSSIRNHCLESWPAKDSSQNLPKSHGPVNCSAPQQGQPKTRGDSDSPPSQPAALSSTLTLWEYHIPCANPDHRPVCTTSSRFHSSTPPLSFLYHKSPHWKDQQISANFFFGRSLRERLTPPLSDLEWEKSARTPGSSDSLTD